MKRSSKCFWGAEDGGITLDWVVLAAMVIGVLFGALTVFSNGAADHAALAGQTLDDQEIGELCE